MDNTHQHGRDLDLLPSILYDQNTIEPGPRTACSTNCGLKTNIRNLLDVRAGARTIFEDSVTVERPSIALRKFGSEESAALPLSSAVHLHYNHLLSSSPLPLYRPASEYTT